MLDNIRYFIEDYWKIILAVFGGVIVVIAGIFIFTGGNGEDSPEGLVTEDNYEEVEQSESEDTTEDKQTQDNGSEGSEEDVEESEGGDTTDSEPTESNLVENEPEYNIEEEFTVSEETQSIIEDNQELNEKYDKVYEDSGFSADENSSLVEAYQTYTDEVNKDYGCTEGFETDFSDCLYKALGYANSMTTDKDDRERFDTILDDVLSSMLTQRGVIKDMERIYGNLTLTNEVVDENVKQAINMLYTSNSIQLEALDTALVDSDNLNMQSTDEDFNGYKEGVNEVYNDSEYINEEVLSFLDSTISQVSKYE